MQIISWTETAVNAENPDIIQLNKYLMGVFRLTEKIIL